MTVYLLSKISFWAARAQL